MQDMHEHATIKVMKRLLSLVLLLSLCIPVVVAAAEIRGINRYVLPPEQVVEGNDYVAAHDITIQGLVKGDVVGVGGTIVSTGIVENDTFFLGGSVYSSSTVKGDLRIIGGNVRVNGIVEGDLVAAGGTVEIMPQAQIKGDIILIGGEVKATSEVHQKLKIVAAQAILNGIMLGTADITAHTFVVGSGATLSGTTTYFSNKEAHIEDGARIIGTLSFNQTQWIGDQSSLKTMLVNFVNFWMLLQFINTLLLAFILLFVFKPFSQEIVEAGTKRFGKNLLTGIGALLAVPILAVIFVASLFALPMGILLILGFAIVYIVSSAYAGMIAGLFIKRHLFQKYDDEVNFLVAVIGISALAFLHFLPYVGDIIRLAFFFVAIGTICRKIYTMVRS
jgi:cytoskeletal protein CcmA (bactofilin family)